MDSLLIDATKTLDDLQLGPSNASNEGLILILLFITAIFSIGAVVYYGGSENVSLAERRLELKIAVACTIVATLFGFGAYMMFSDVNKDALHSYDATKSTVVYKVATNRNGSPMMKTSPKLGKNVLQIKVTTKDGKSEWVAIDKANAEIRYNIAKKSQVVLKKYHDKGTNKNYYVVSHVDLNFEK